MNLNTDFQIVSISFSVLCNLALWRCSSRHGSVILLLLSFVDLLSMPEEEELLCMNSIEPLLIIMSYIKGNGFTCNLSNFRYLLFVFLPAPLEKGSALSRNNFHLRREIFPFRVDTIEKRNKSILTVPSLASLFIPFSMVTHWSPKKLYRSTFIVVEQERLSKAHFFSSRGSVLFDRPFTIWPKGRHPLWLSYRLH